MERGRVLLFAALMIYTTCSTLKITRDGCGTTELCLASPDNCDPAGNDSCMFVSFEFVPPAQVIFRLRGDSGFYTTVGLTQNFSQGETEFFACVATELKVGGVSYGNPFLYVMRNNTDNSANRDDSKTFESTQLEVVGNIVKCQFSLSGLNSSSTRGNNDLDFVVILGKGASREFSSLNISLITGLLDLSIRGANIPTTTAPTSMVSTNTSMVPTAAARGPNQIHALLTLSALMLSVMLRG
ncbi:ferric-chelate reductase 1-like [Takifugu rubripes]|uniref:ferric-chelate reductase 1-like n=1 Tax=Takifugu rubripes TaxID=31033 RepID=UPI001145E46E|nr:ferric-chelate reductase 1-like [Takifugu rubripes]